MSSRNGARGGISLAFIILLILPNMSVSGSSSLEETGDDFSNGAMENVNVRSGSIALDMANESLINDWTLRSCGTPTPRSGHALIFDSAHGVIVLFGGYSPGRFLDETWTYDKNTNNWTNMNPPTAPSGRSGFGMVYDNAHDTIVMFGGDDSGMFLQNDTWTYDLGTNDWTNMKPATAPSARESFSMVYDSAHGEVVLFGGMNGTQHYSDTWTYNLTNNEWTDQNPMSSPSAREGHDMAYDTANGMVVLLGGTGNGDNVLNDTWVYDPISNAWANKDPMHTPPPKTSHCMVYDSAAGQTVSFGGWDGNNRTDNTWVYNLSANDWMMKDPETSPTARTGFTMAYDSAHNESVLFGGYGGYGYMNDIWAYDSVENDWTEQNPPVSPLGRDQHAMVYSAAHGEVILFGGRGSYFWGEQNDTWAYDPVTNQWKNLFPSTSPPARYEHAMAYDSARDEVILFGGTGSGTMTNDTWAYSLTTNDWTNLKPENAPSRRRGDSMVYDSLHGVMVLFGGSGGSGCLNDTWTYDRNTNNWTSMNPPKAPPGRFGHAMAYDLRHGKILLFGGSDGTRLLGGTWTYNLTTNDWTDMEPPDEPPVRCFCKLTYDIAHGEMLLFGGYVHGDSLGDTWTYELNTNTWMNKNPSTAPMARYHYDMIYDSLNLEVILFGGGTKNNDLLDDMWIYEFGTFHNIGNYVSIPHDSEGLAYYGSISWDADVPPGTSLRFQFRSADTKENLTAAQFLGPDGTHISYYGADDRQISSVNNGTRWFQYRAHLGTGDFTATPSLSGVTIAFNLLQKITIASPAGGENWTGPQNITWSASDPDNDTLAFDIFLENATARVPLVTDLPDGTSTWPWNTSSVPNGTYRIRISAVDDNPSIPLTVDAVSENFTIFHPPPPPPPNLPPTISLLSPPNNSVIDSESVLLTWNGSDSEGDALFYMLVLEWPGLDPFDNTPYITIEESLEMNDLKDNRTYYWTVTAAEKDNPENAAMSEKWSFTVHLQSPPPPVNHPPRITSIPKTTVTAGNLYQYNVTAVDDDFDTVEFSLVGAPGNMTIDNVSGRLRWQTTLSDIGNHSTTIRVTDTAGATDNQTFTIAVLEPILPPEKPQCIITSPANNTQASGRITVQGTATNGTLPITIVQVRLDGGEWQTASGLAGWSLSLDLSKTPNGRHTIEARSFDGSLYSDTASIQVDIRNPEPTTTIGEPPWLLVWLFIVITAGVGIYLVSRWRKGA